MEHRALGRSGVDVSRIILGCGNFGGIGSSPAFFGRGETEGEAHALVAAGRIRAYGGSNADAAWLEEALRHGNPAWVQNSYSLLERGDETSVLPVVAREGLGYTPFSPLAGGWLTGKYRRGEEPPAGSRMTLRPEPYAHLLDDGVFDGLEAFEAAAAERGTSPAALAIAWLLAHPQVTAVVIGPRRPEQLLPALEALELRLSPPEHEQLAMMFP
jgi:aryl-alcohol dehydrogenase-like predicted oxidoreductase